MPHNPPEVLALDFLRFCEANPNQRFWQALRNWSDYSFVYVSNDRKAEEAGLVKDTFYFQGKDK